MKSKLYFLIQHGEFEGYNYLSKWGMEHFLFKSRKNAVECLKEKLSMKYCFSRRMWVNGRFGADLMSIPLLDSKKASDIIKLQEDKII